MWLFTKGDGETDELQLAGNVRELQNVVERAVVLASGTIVDLDESMLHSHSVMPDPALDTLENMERNHILRALGETHWMIHGHLQQ